MKTRNMMVVLVIGLFLFGAVSADAQMGKGQFRGQGGKQSGQMRGQCQGLHELLDLTPEQISQMKGSQVEMKKRLIPLQADLKMAKLELHELMRNDASKAAIDGKIDEIGSIRAEMQKIRVGHRLEFRSMLTDEQKAKLDAMPMGGPGCGHGRGGPDHGMRGDCPFHGGGFGPGRGAGTGDCFRFSDDGI